MLSLRKLAATVALTITLIGPATAADNMTLLMELQSTVDGKVETKVSLWGTQTDPNKRSSSDQYRLTINGKVADIPHDFLATLSAQRRSYSYDAQSNGIENNTRQALCMMAGPALGDVLYTRYLTYENSQIVSSEMRPVFSEAGNCLFASEISPNATNAQLAAAKALARLQTLRALAQH